jgi:hypothetical protein
VINLSQLCRELLATNHQVHTLMFAAMMPNLSSAEVKALKRQEGLVRQERRRLCRLIRDEVRLRVDAWDHGRAYSQVESTKRFTARRGSRGK